MCIAHATPTGYIASTLGLYGSGCERNPARLVSDRVVDTITFRA